VQIIRVIYSTDIAYTKVKQYYNDILIRTFRKFIKSSDIKKYVASCNDVQSRGFGTSHVIYAHAHRQSCHFVLAEVAPYREVWGVDVDMAAGFERTPPVLEANDPYCFGLICLICLIRSTPIPHAGANIALYLQHSTIVIHVLPAPRAWSRVTPRENLDISRYLNSIFERANLYMLYEENIH